MSTAERQITFAPHGHVLTNVNVWSPDSRRIVYDVRSDAEGAAFDGTRIESVHVESGDVQLLYASDRGACCGVATYHPHQDRVLFILGPHDPTPDWTYGPPRRRGVMVDAAQPGHAIALDARDLSPPFTPGALRGGSHVHVFSPDGALVSFTYEDHVLATRSSRDADDDVNARNIGVSVLGHPVRVPRTHPRNQDGEAFSVLITRTTRAPQPGSDQYSRAYEEGWVGQDGYLRADGSRQRRAIAFVGDVHARDGRTLGEVFIADLPDDLTRASEQVPLAGTDCRMPSPPAGVMVRRLTRSEGHRFSGIQGVRHWLRASPDGAAIAFLSRDDAGVVQLYAVSPLGGVPRPLTSNATDVSSAFTWSADGRHIAHVMDNSVCVTDAATGQTRRLTPRSEGDSAPLPLASVFSPDGRHIAYLRRVVEGASHRRFNQIFVTKI